jgi:hypothetical protein
MLGEFLGGYCREVSVLVAMRAHWHEGEISCVYLGCQFYGAARGSDQVLGHERPDCDCSAVAVDVADLIFVESARWAGHIIGPLGLQHIYPGSCH